MSTVTDFISRFFADLLAYPHPMVNHFVIAPLIVSVVLEFYGRWNPAIRFTAWVMLALGALATIPTVITGLIAHFPYEKTSAIGAIETHEQLGLATAGIFMAPTTVVACHPGLARTELGRDSTAGKVLMPLVGLFLNTSAMGAWGALHAATGQIKPGGYYGPTGFGELRGPSRECSPSEQARDPQLARRLRDVSVAMTGIDPGLSPVR